MTKYYQYLAAGIGNNITQLRWSTPYIDGGGLGEMVSVSRPVYDKFYNGNETSYKLIGVVSTDVLMNTLKSYSNYANIITNLISRSSQCFKFKMSDCNLQLLRNPDGNNRDMECQNTDIKYDGTYYPSLDSPLCRSSVSSDASLQCSGSSSRLSLENVLCQNINSATLKPISSSGENVFMQSYEQYICCLGCSRVETIVGLAVGGIGFLVIWRPF